MMLPGGQTVTVTAKLLMWKDFKVSVAMWAPGCLVFFGDDILPSYIRIIS